MLEEISQNIKEEIKEKKASLAKRYGVFIFILVIILMALLLFISSAIVTSWIDKSYDGMAKEVVAGRSAEIVKWIDVYKNDLKVYSDADVVKTGDPDQIIAWLQNHTELRNPDYDYMFFCTTEGTSYRDTVLVGGEVALTECD